MEPEPINKEPQSGLHVGAVFADRYEVIAKIGQGGMCDVYLVHDPFLDRRVALKVLKPHLSCDPHACQRFRDEVRATSLLQHTNIVSVLFFGTSKDGSPYFAMEHLQGRTLERVFQDEGKTNKERFEQIFLPVLNALVYAHSLNIVHRDLETDNIMLCPGDDGEQVKLLDFGIAKILEAKNPDDSQATVALLGSPHYMSPEQCAGARVDKRSDIYSLACVMYEALVGKPPFAGENAMATMYGHLKVSVPRLEEVSARLHISRLLVRTIVRALAKNPSGRQESMSEFQKEITDSLAAADESINPSRRNKHIMLAIAVLLVCILLLVSFAAVQRHVRTAQHPQILPAEQARFASGIKTTLPAHTAGNVNQPAVFSEIERLIVEGKFSSAENKCQQAIKVGEANREERPEYIYQARMSYGDVYAAIKKYGPACREYHLAAEVFQLPKSSSRLDAVDKLCAILVLSGRAKEAIQTYRQYLQAADESLEGDLNEHVAHAYMNFAELLEKQNEPAEALAVANKGLRICWLRPDLHKDEFTALAAWDVYRLDKKLGKVAAGKKIVEECRKWLKEPGTDCASRGALEYATGARRNGCLADAAEMYKFSLKESYKLSPDEARPLQAECNQHLKALQKALAADRH